MATPGAASAAGGSRPGPEEQPAPAPGASQAAAPPEQPAPPLPLPPQAPSQPAPAEQKFQSPAAQAPQQQPPPTAAALQHQGQEDCSFLPLVHDVIKCSLKIQKFSPVQLFPAQRPDGKSCSSKNSPAKAAIQYTLTWDMDKDSQDVHQVLNELRTKFVEMRKVIKAMQGIGMSPEQQQLQLQSLREQVKTKSELLQKYKSLCMFEVPKE